MEGAEYELLKGCTKILSMVPKPIWILEICLAEHHPEGLNPNFSETFSVFRNSGYEAKSMGGGVIFEEDVERWVNAGATDYGSHNFCFVATA